MSDYMEQGNPWEDICNECRTWDQDYEIVDGVRVDKCPTCPCNPQNWKEKESL